MKLNLFSIINAINFIWNTNKMFYNFVWIIKHFTDLYSKSCWLIRQLLMQSCFFFLKFLVLLYSPTHKLAYIGRYSSVIHSEIRAKKSLYSKKHFFKTALILVCIRAKLTIYFNVGFKFSSSNSPVFLFIIKWFITLHSLNMQNFV